MQQIELLKHTDKINELLARYGVKFGIYKNNVFKEQLELFRTISFMPPADIWRNVKEQFLQRGFIPTYPELTW